MAPWRAPTLKDHLDTLPSASRAAFIVQESDVGNHLAYCDECGRKTNADMLMDTRTLSAAHRLTLKLRGAFACDGCRERWIRERHITRDALYLALGAPADIITRIREQMHAAGE